MMPVDDQRTVRSVLSFMTECVDAIVARKSIRHDSTQERQHIEAMCMNTMDAMCIAVVLVLHKDNACLTLDDLYHVILHVEAPSRIQDDGEIMFTAAHQANTIHGIVFNHMTS